MKDKLTCLLLQNLTLFFLQVRSKCCKWLHNIKKDQDFNRRHHHHPVGPDGRRRPFGATDSQINPNSGYPLHAVRTTMQSNTSNGYPVNASSESPTGEYCWKNFDISFFLSVSIVFFLLNFKNY